MCAKLNRLITQNNCLIFFFVNDTATTEIYTLSLHDALPILRSLLSSQWTLIILLCGACCGALLLFAEARSEEHTSELQSHVNFVCRLLLEKKNNQANALARWVYLASCVCSEKKPTI